ncbi:amino acid permease [Candidatus Poribacteria bacterium]|nr:amino acid permease [Candidatus Poribacteria bacterium]
MKRIIFGAPRDLEDKTVFHRLSVVAFLAWVGLGADGLSSSVYGPEEGFLSLGEHRYLAVALALFTVATVVIISTCYSRIIERFPHGGGGYVVATALLGERAGVLSGSALLVDYVLTVTVSIAAAGDALFSLAGPEWHGLKFPTEVALIAGLTILNIRGVRESILTLMPVFLVFLAAHSVLIGGGIAAKAASLVPVAHETAAGFRGGLSTLGLGGMVLLFFHAYSLGGGTYTGIEAVSNGLPIMREPRAATARRTMVYMAASLAITAAGLVVCYLLWSVSSEPGKTLNAVLSERVAEGLSLGKTFVAIVLFSEGALLVVAAQAGFLDGPRVLANMAVDSWLPRRFAALSERLTSQNGIVLMGAAALAALLYTRGNVRHIVVMYSINVFLTFSLSMLGMARAIASEHGKGTNWRRAFALFATGFVLCATILTVTLFEKFTEGGWITLLVTSLLALLCFRVRRHYRALDRKLRQLYDGLSEAKGTLTRPPDPLDPADPTAVFLVGGYTGLGIHTILTALRMFPGQFRNVVLVSAGIIDSGIFKGADTLTSLREQTEEGLRKYVHFVESHGFKACSRSAYGTDVVAELDSVCLTVVREFPNATFFAGQLVFEREQFLERYLHNETTFALQRRLQRAEQTLVILPARVG